MVRHAVGLIIAESSQQRRLECCTNKAPDMHWESWTVSSIPAEPKVLQVRHQAHMHAAWDRSSLTVEPAKKPRVSSHESK